MAKKVNSQPADVIDQEAQKLEDLVKSFEPEKKEEETLAESLVKSAAESENEPEDEEEDEDKEEMKQSHASASVTEKMKKSLDESEGYQQVIDVAEPIQVLGDAMVKGFQGLEKSQGNLSARLARLEKNLGLSMRAQAVILQQLSDRQPVRTPMTGNLGGFKKSQTVGEEKKDGKLGHTAKQLERAATILVEEGKLPVGSGAVLSARGAEALYKSLGVEHQNLLTEVIEKEQL